MNGDLEEIIIGKFVFTGFAPRPLTGRAPWTLFVVRKIDFSKLVEEDIEEVKNTLRNVDLWENLMSTIKTIHLEIAGEKFDEKILENLYYQDKYEVKVSKEPDLDDVIQVEMSYSKFEAERRTKGARSSNPLNVEEIKQKIKNINKWLMFKEIKNNIG